jgi:hypothetical protein
MTTWKGARAVVFMILFGAPERADPVGCPHKVDQVIGASGDAPQVMGKLDRITQSWIG